MDWKVSDSCITIYDSWEVSKHDFDSVLFEIETAYPENKVICERSMCSLKLEWACHNFLYKINYKRKRTKDTDLEYPQPWYMKIGYTLGGIMVWLFIK